MRKWSIKIYLLNEKGEEVPANILDRVTYHLHPSFGDRAKQGTCEVSFSLCALPISYALRHASAARNSKVYATTAITAHPRTV